MEQNKGEKESPLPDRIDSSVGILDDIGIFLNMSRWRL